MANRSNQKLLQVLRSDDSGFDRIFAGIRGLEGKPGGNVGKEVSKIIERVRSGGDRELLACVRKFDGAKLKALEVSREEWDAGCDEVDPLRFAGPRGRASPLFRACGGSRSS